MLAPPPSDPEPAPETKPAAPVKSASVKRPISRGTIRVLKDQLSEVTNGDGVRLPSVDGRSAIARRFRDVVGAILSDQGGLDRCSETRQQLIRRFAAAAVLAEQMESRLANGETISIADHSHLTSTMVRVAQRIGIGRRARDVVPTVGQYLMNQEPADDTGEAAE